MKHLKKEELKHFLEHFTYEGLSMRRKFMLYILSIISVFLALLLVLLNLFGILNPAHRQMVDELDLQLHSSANTIENNFDQLAAHAISFAEQLEDSIQDYLGENNLSFEELENNPSVINDLQARLYNTVYLNMQLAPSSGAFYILDTTVNTHSALPLYNGIYLKYVNLYSENTVNNDFALYRGSFHTGKLNNIAFHSGWQNENQTDFFETCDSTFTKGIHYAVSPVVEIPDTWEKARYIYVPVHDLKDTVIGVCGFEINDLLFQLSTNTDTRNLDNVICHLLDETYEEEELSVFDFGNTQYIGRTKQLYLGNDTFTVAVMITQAQYDKFIYNGQINIIAICLIVGILAFGCCIFMSKKYITPILKKIEQIKIEEDYGEQFVIREIDDLFTFLEEKDRRYEQQLIDLEKAKQHAEMEAEKTKAAYEQALAKYNLAKDEINQLAEKNKKDIALEDYEFFVCNLGTLTAAEYRIYELYLSGKTAKQIAEILGITENTLKYHNKNIYSKLGISSRKQLLRFAALKQYQDKNGNRS